MNSFYSFLTTKYPSNRMITNQHIEKYGIVHFGLNTFTNREWGSGGEDPQIFNPTACDIAQIVEAAQCGGLEGIILVCKHHDGFCLWPTKTTTYNISATPWQDGKGDLVKEFSEKCKYFNIRFGVYISPWDRNNPFYGSTQYVKIYQEQIREVLTNYGPIFEVWFDGANGGSGYYGGANETRCIDASTYYEWEKIWKMVRELQPNAMIFSDTGPDKRWAGNERGYLHPECRSEITFQSRNPRIPPCPGNVKSAELNKGVINGQYIVQPECDFPLRKNWFYRSEDDEDIKSPEKLIDIYFNSVGCGGTMNIGLSPNRTGKLCHKDVEILCLFNNKIKHLFSNCKYQGYFNFNQNSSIIEFENETTFNLIALAEKFETGEKITSYRIERVQNGVWQEIMAGESIGKLRLRIVNKCTAKALRFTIMGAKEKVDKISIQVYDTEVLPSSTQNIDSRLKKTPNYKKIVPVSIENLSAVFAFETPIKIRTFCFEPDPEHVEGTPDCFKLEESIDGSSWKEVCSDEFSNILANPVLQTVHLVNIPCVKYLKFTALKIFGTQTKQIVFKEFGIITE